MGRLRFGGIGPSTHFLELQEVEEILDPAAATELGIRPGRSPCSSTTAAGS